MRPHHKLLIAVVLGATLLGDATTTRAQGKFVLAEGDVVVFVGGANMLHLQQAGYLEAMLTRAFATARPGFRDLSWEADTVFRQGTVIERWRTDGFGALDDQLERVGATVVIAQFGRLESMAGADGLHEFTKAYERLIDAFQKRARLVVVVTPTPFERPPSSRIPDLSEHNDDLALYVKSMTEMVAAQHDAPAQRGAEKKIGELLLVDLFTGAKAGLTHNGMHVENNAQGHVAREIARQLGVPLPTRAELEPLRLAVVEKHRLWYDYWRPANWKLLYGDDSRRQFTRGGNSYIPFRQEWNKLVPLIAKAEQRVWQIANGAGDPGDSRPAPELLHGDPDANLQAELKAFALPAGFRINLFASERQGLTSPLAIRWDPAGRMYVTVTTTYPHVFPGDLPNDKIIVLEDTDDDGQADKSTVFADGLNIPTGLELGDGGVYVGQNTELLFLRDTDGDGRADQRRVVLGGFGNGDSHQTINSFVWSPGGELYFGQGDGIESRVETPWGASNLFQAGFYRFRPRRLQLHPLLDDFMGPGNPWGVAFDEWGQIFSIDGAGGVTFLSPGQVPTNHRLRLRTIGEPGGYCGIGYLDGRHLPESMHGDFVVGDFKANRVKRFSVNSDGAGFSLRWKEPILRSRHRNFRPVDVKVGPDGAIYVVDWYNPITCHQDDAYRDPARDKAHGRIWRLSAKTAAGAAAPARPPDLTRAPIHDVLDALTSPEHFTRYQAKRALTDREPSVVAKALDKWVRDLDPKLPRYEHHLYEALGAYATIEVVEPNLLRRLLQAQDPRARAYATRVIGRWHDRLEHPFDLLAQRVVDAHPLVRMEAVIACAAIPASRSIEVAARVVDQPMDSWTEYAFKQAVHHLQPYWMPAFRRGDVACARPSQLAAVLHEAGGRDVLESLKELVEADDLKRASRSSAIAAILAVGGPQEVQSYGLDPARFTQAAGYDTTQHAEALTQLVQVARFRDVRPSGDLAASLSQLIGQADPQVQANALLLAGIWKVERTQHEVLTAANNDALPIHVRAAAFRAMIDMELPASREVLAAHAHESNSPKLRSAAIQSLAAVELRAAAGYAADLFASHELTLPDSASTLLAFLNRTGGAEALSSALQSKGLQPEPARQVLTSLFSTGRSSVVLYAALSQAVGASTQSPDYSDTYVTRLARDAHRLGVAQRGAVVFKSIACVSCHKVGGVGRTVGPDLTAIGSTLSAERIVEELLWPNRQIKEGYSVMQVITDTGRIHQGYERRTRQSQEAGEVVIQDLVTQEYITFKKANIEEQSVTGSPMPTGLTAVLSRPQLLDLIRYLSELGNIQ